MLFAALRQFLRSRMRRPQPRRPASSLRLEALEARSLLTATGFDDAVPVFLSGQGAGQVLGTIAEAGDRDVYRFTASRAGELTLRAESAAGTTLDTFLEVFDEHGRLLSFNDDASRDARAFTDSLVRLPVVLGQNYFARVSQAVAAPGSPLGGVGDYCLRFNTGAALPDDAGNTLANPLRVAPVPDDRIILTGNVEASADVDTFRFVAPRAGRLDIGLRRTGGNLVPFVHVFDAERRELASNYELPRLFGAGSQGGTRSHRLSLTVAAGQVLLVQAAGFQGSTGSYRLSLGVVDDFPDLRDDAHPIVFDANGSATLLGQIERFTDPNTGRDNADRDVFQFVAPATGTLRIRLEATAGSTLEPVLNVVRATQVNVDIAIDDDQVPATFGAVELHVIQGERYFLTASNLGRKSQDTTGKYRLTFQLSGDDDFADVFQQAAGLALQAGLANLEGTLERPSDRDVFLFVAPAAGRLTVQVTSRSATAVELSAFGVGQESVGVAQAVLIAPGRVAFDVLQGETYYVRIQGATAGVGSYALDFCLAPPEELSLAEGVDGRSVGQVLPTPEGQLFHWTAPTTGLLIPRHGASPRVYSQAGALLPAADGDYVVVAGRRYVVQTAEPVELLFRPGFKEFAPDVAGGRQEFRLVAAGEPDLIAFVPRATGELILSREFVADATLRNSLRLYDAAGELSTAGFGPNAEVMPILEAGTTYYLLVATERLADGDAYSLKSTPLLDDLPGTLAVVLDAEGTARLQGVIERLTDNDTFTFVAPTTAVLTLSVGPDGEGFFDALLSVTDAAGKTIATSDSSENRNILRFNVQAQQTYTLQVGLQSPPEGDTAPFAVSIQPSADEVPDVPLKPPLLPVQTLQTIELPGDVDVFRLQADATGMLTLRLDVLLDRDGGSSLNGFVSLVDADGDLLAAGAGGELTFPVVEGDIYFIEVNALKESAGDYEFSYSIEATPFTLSVTGLAGNSPESLALRAASRPQTTLVVPLADTILNLALIQVAGQETPPNPATSRREEARDEVEAAEVPEEAVRPVSAEPPGAGWQPAAGTLESAYEDIRSQARERTPATELETGPTDSPTPPRLEKQDAEPERPESVSSMSLPVAVEQALAPLGAGESADVNPLIVAALFAGGWVTRGRAVIDSARATAEVWGCRAAAREPHSC